MLPGSRGVAAGQAVSGLGGGDGFGRHWRIFAPFILNLLQDEYPANERNRIAGGVEILPGSDLFSHFVAKAVSSALGRFTTVFGMGTGGATPLEPPGSKSNGDQYALFFTIWQGVNQRIWKIGKIHIRDYPGRP